jgi:membrane protease YdiL (CAAX protease family)
MTLVWLGLFVLVYYGTDKGVDALARWLFPLPPGKGFVSTYGPTWTILLLGLGPVANMVSILALFGLVRNRLPGQPESAPDSSEFNWRRIAATVGWGGLGAATLLIFDPPVHDPRNGMMVAIRLDRVWLMGFVVVVSAPLLEELVFRGIALNMLRASMLRSSRPAVRQLATPTAMLVTATMFGAVHPGHFLSTFAAAIVFAFVYWKTSRLEASIISHAGNNLGNVLYDVLHS